MVHIINADYPWLEKRRPPVGGLLRGSDLSSDQFKKVCPQILGRRSMG